MALIVEADNLFQSYLFVMGKLNVPKMANFMEVDVFVLVACPENTLIDSKVWQSKFVKTIDTLKLLSF